VPNAPLRNCPRPRCPNKTPGGLCPQHLQEREQRKAQSRGSAQQRGYDAEWAAYAKAWLEQFPWCGQRQDGQLYAEHSRCVQRGLRVRARCVDHIKPIRTGGSRLDPSNHQSMCWSCNAAKG